MSEKKWRQFNIRVNESTHFRVKSFALSERKSISDYLMGCEKKYRSLKNLLMQYRLSCSDPETMQVIVDIWNTALPDYDYDSGELKVVEDVQD